MLTVEEVLKPYSRPMANRTFLFHMMAGSIELTALSRELREAPSYSAFRNELKELDYSGYANFGGRGACLIVDKVPNQNEVLIRAGAECFVRRDGNPVEMDFKVVYSDRSERWEIANMVMRRLQ